MFSDLGKDFSWIQRHERIILVAMVLAVSAFGLNKWIDKSAMDAASKAAVAQQVAAVQHDADVKLAAAVAQQTTLFNQERQAREQEMASLVAAVASRDVASNNQIAAVGHPKDIAQAIGDLQTAYQDNPLFREPWSVALTPNGVAAEFDAEHISQFTVAKIEADTAKADLIDTRKELETTEAGLASATSLVGALQGQVTGLQTEIKTNADASKAEIASVKASARKSKVGWFKFGFVTGFVSGLVTGHFIH
jgi:hypothetical protein